MAKTEQNTISRTPEERDYLDSIAPPINLTLRSIRLNTLLNQTSLNTPNSALNMRDIMLADFGVASPNGLDLRPFDNFKIPIKPTPADMAFIGTSTIKALGYANASGEILMSPDMLLAAIDPETKKPTLAFNPGSTLAHEATHILQFRQGQMQGFSPVFEKRFMDDVFAPAPWSTLGNITNNLQTYFNRAAANYQDFTNNHRFKDYITLRFWTGLTTDGLITQMSRIRDYVAADYEIQARMHQTLAAGYTVWGKMPTNTLELQATFYNCGATMPDSVSDNLKNTQAGRDAVKAFHVPESIMGPLTMGIDSMNQIYDYAGNRENRERLWTHAMPGIYGHLLELYGDTLGRERMDLGKNKNDIHVVTYMLQTQGNAHSSYLRQALQAVLPENITDLANTLIRNPRFSAIPKTQSVFDILLENPNTRQQVTNPDRVNSYGAIGSMTPLEVALVYGRVDIIRMLIKNGADPFHETEFYNAATDTTEKRSPITIVGDYARKIGAVPGEQSLKGLWKKYSKPHQHETLMIGLNALNSCPEIDRNTRHNVTLEDGKPPVNASFSELMARVGLTPPQAGRDKGLEIPAHI